MYDQDLLGFKAWQARTFTVFELVSPLLVARRMCLVHPCC